MSTWREKIVTKFKQYAGIKMDDDPRIVDPLVWSRKIERHPYGKFSFSVAQGNAVIEDYSEVETGRDAIFVGVYDGHGGPDASEFISKHLFANLKRLAGESGDITEDILRNAFAETENGFLAHVRTNYGIRPSIASTGSCCLVGVIWRGTLFVANLGDSRAVMGRSQEFNMIFAQQLTRDDNVNQQEVRLELESAHPDDPEIVVFKNGAWRVRGIIQVSRTIGDIYLKQQEFSRDVPSSSRSNPPRPLVRPVLSSEPTISTRVLQDNDKFLIFASDGLWEHMTNQEAAEIVNKNPRTGIATRLVKKALITAAKKRQRTYDVLKGINRAARRAYHDDITVVVVFIDKKLLKNSASVSGISIHGFNNNVEPSNFNIPSTD